MWVGEVALEFGYILFLKQSITIHLQTKQTYKIQTYNQVDTTDEIPKITGIRQYQPLNRKT